MASMVRIMLIVGGLSVIAGATVEACTIGVASGRATADGRPLLWKVRDDSLDRDNEVHYHDALTYPFACVVSAGDESTPAVRMGVNVHGFAIVNAYADWWGNPVPSTRSNGDFMRLALGGCRSVAEFIALLDATQGERDVRASFAVIDSTGAAFVVEAVPASYYTYDAAATADGFLIRTNFACADTVGAGGPPNLPGGAQFMRSYEVIGTLVADGGLTPTDLIDLHARDFSNVVGELIPIPCTDCGGAGQPGWFQPDHSICNNASVSSAVIHGVSPDPAAGEPAWLTTLWVQLGSPACAIAVPYWPLGPPPPEANGEFTSPLCDAALDHRDLVFQRAYDMWWVDSFALRDGEGGGLWPPLRQAEQGVITVADEHLTRWREAAPPFAEVLALEDSLATAAHDALVDGVVTAAAPPASDSLALTAAPNPFNPAVVLAFSLPRAGHAELAIHDLAGRRLAVLCNDVLDAGRHRRTWRPARLASGVYLVRLRTADAATSQRVVLVR